MTGAMIMRMRYGTTMVAATALVLGVVLGGASGLRAADDTVIDQAEGALQDLSDLLQTLSKALPEGEAFVASSFAQAIRDVHERAKPKARPIPAAIKTDLASFFSTTPWLLDKARWVTADEIGGVTDLVLLNPDVTAITIDDIVVFRDGASAESDRALWAHELVHVLQYETLGVDGFAKDYLESGGTDFEAEAEAFAGRVREKLGVAKPKQIQS